jgi:DNA-binding NarL/FixJ family response regulator
MSQQNSLTERQELILRLISEGRTNGDIADVLGYSESLIRQETIRIYAHLGCSGRTEAASIFRAMNLDLKSEKGLAKQS